MRRALRRLRPATVRMRLILLVTVVAAVLLTAGAVTAAVAVRASLVQSAFRSVDDGNRLTVFSTTEFALGPPSHCDKESCTGTAYHWDGGLRDTFPLIRGGGLSLCPWTDPSDARDLTLVPPDGSHPIAIRSLYDEQSELNTAVWWLAGGTLGLTLLIAGGSWLPVGRVLKPVEAIRAEFADLSLHHLDRRIPVPRSGREFARLASTMNTTLDRLEAAVDHQRQFTADASHELRTPLACLRTELELALSRPDTTRWPQVTRDALGDTVRLQTITADLLLLARLDTQAADPRARRRAERVDLAELVRDEVARRDPPSHLTLTVTAPDSGPVVSGHPGMLARVLANLLDNAERHAETAVIVTVALSEDGDRRQAVLDVWNDGPAIPAEHHEVIFERFARLDDARARDTGGAGLGLAIAHRVLTIHHGTLALTPVEHGARFTVRLPVARTRARDAAWHASGVDAAVDVWERVVHLREAKETAQARDVLADAGRHLSAPAVADLLELLEAPDDVISLLGPVALRSPLEDWLPDFVDALGSAGHESHLATLLRLVTCHAPAWEVAGLTLLLHDEDTADTGRALLAAFTEQRGPLARRALRRRLDGLG